MFSERLNMIKGIFCHDLPIYKDINGEYCCTTLTDSVFNRYLSVVDELVVATRVYSLDCTYSEAHQERITLKNIRFLDIPNLNKPQYIFSRIPKAWKMIETEMNKCQLIFIRGGIIGLLASKIARKNKRSYLCECTGCAWDEYWNHSLCGKLIAPFMEYNEKKTVKNAAYVVYVTNKYLQKRYPSNGVSAGISDVVIKGVSDSILEKRFAKIKKWGNEKNEWVIGTTAGVNNKAKGQQYVIKAMSELRDDIEIRYELVGTGDQSYLKSVAKKYDLEKNVVFKGELTHEEVLKWLDTIDTYIQPSMQEGLPRSLVEAMSRACPCIGSTTGGIPELLERKAIFRRGNIRDLTKRMIKFYSCNWRKRSKFNFLKSKEFLEEVLDEKRENIFKQYRKDILKENDF